MRSELAALTEVEREMLRANSPGESLGYWERRPVAEVEAAVAAVRRMQRRATLPSITREALWGDQT